MLYRVKIVAISPTGQRQECDRTLQGDSQQAAISLGCQLLGIDGTWDIKCQEARPLQIQSAGGKR